jgi:hypothetical protein
LTPPLDINAYFGALVARASTAVVVPLMPMSYADSDFNNCHVNAARWAAANPEYAAVGGWLLWPQAGPPYILHAHSVVKGPEGLVDVTPLREKGLHFLEHQGSGEEFSWLATNFAQYTHGLDLSQMHPPAPPRFDLLRSPQRP